MCAHAWAHAHTCTIGYGKKERDCLHRDLIPYTVIRTRSCRNFWVWIGDDCGRVRKLIQEFYPGGPVFAVCCQCLTAFALSWSSGGGALQEICCDQHHARRKKEFMWCWSLGETNCRCNFLHTLTQKTKSYKRRELKYFKANPRLWLAVMKFTAITKLLCFSAKKFWFLPVFANMRFLFRVFCTNN